MSSVLDLLSFAAAVLLLFSGAGVALAAQNVTKRFIAIFIAMLGAMLAAAALHVNAANLMAGAAVAAAYVIIAIPVMIRVQEQYGGIEADGLDAADLAGEPPGPSE
jgi:hypothetical protein